jgi:phosphomannomutase
MIATDTHPRAARPAGRSIDGPARRLRREGRDAFIDVAAIKPFNVVLDAAAAWRAWSAPKLFDRLPCKTTKLCFTIDGTFPTHEANPLLEENRADITARVIADKADIGIAWDGDADRCFFIDGTGEFIAGDFITALLAEAFLLKIPNEKIIYDVRASFAVKRDRRRAMAAPRS